MTAAAKIKLKFTTFKISQNPVKAIIGLHGWTGDDKSFIPVAKSLNLKSAKWFNPRAPYGADPKSGYTWFKGNDEEGWKYEKSWAGLDELLNHIQIQGFATENIYLLGFSQGATLALEYGQRLPFALGGIIAVAGFIKNKEKLSQESSPASLNNSILLLHGEQDQIVSHRHSAESYDYFSRQGNSVRLETYQAGHKIPLEAITLIKKYINNN